MPEIKTKPTRIKVGDTDFDCFSEEHTLSDISRWIYYDIGRADAEEVVRILQEFIDDNDV